MTIGVDIRSILEEQLTGVGEYTLNLLKALFQIDQTNKYKLFFNTAGRVKVKIPEFYRPDVKIYSRRIPNKLLNLSLRFLNWPKIDELMTEDINPTNSYPGVNLFFIPNHNFLSLSLGCKKIITVHDLSFEYFPEFYTSKRRLWHKIVNLKKLVIQADKVIAVSESTKQDLVELYNLDEDKIKVIYSGVSEEFGILEQDKRIGEIIKKYQLPKNFILYLGTLEPRKNIEGLIKAFEALLTNYPLPIINYQLIIAGRRGWLDNNIYQTARKSKVSDKIKFIGFVDARDKPYLYNLAKIFVYPSFYEGFGFPPLEAASSGLPVITSSVSSFPEIMGGAALIIDPYNISELAEAMYQVLTNQSLWLDLQEKGLKQAQKFSWAKCAQETLKTFEELNY